MLPGRIWFYQVGFCAEVGLCITRSDLVLPSRTLYFSGLPVETLYVGLCTIASDFVLPGWIVYSEVGLCTTWSGSVLPCRTLASAWISERERKRKKTRTKEATLPSLFPPPCLSSLPFLPLPPLPWPLFLFSSPLPLLFLFKISITKTSKPVSGVFALKEFPVSPARLFWHLSAAINGELPHG